MTIEALKTRAKYLQKIRGYFDNLGVLEVDTPLGYTHAVSDPYINTFAIATKSGKRFLQTSPEYAMKRLLAEGSGSIYQICKAFRDDPQGKLHNYEFTMLEWYRVGIDHHQLMKEIADLIYLLKPGAVIEYTRYQEIFQRYIGVNPHKASLKTLQKLVDQHIGRIVGLDFPDKFNCLDLLFTHCIEPQLKNDDRFLFIYHYPKAQSALARIIDENEQKVAARFELFYQGIELGNGYYELTDANELQQRFQNDLKARNQQKNMHIEIDKTLIKATQSLPDCAGVAIGLDRLLLCIANYQRIADILFCV
ncbi:EF-P lysine aminoacylase EpmA [Facilibium subflavum]|uniref:EF-P lysine aminoacylase EpmA n=1 Tax=Facilibium subflavum TaxID=2219058 RepID=UPI000E64A5D4|nr:EF-P lysine aminoacylase EpmA [Facilibium subflavum]